MTTDFVSSFLLSRNYKIQVIVHVGRKSAVVLSGITEAPYSHFFIGIDSDCFNCNFLVFVEKLQKLSLTSL